VATGATPVAAMAQAREEMLIAEGSDWFWWYGDDHSSDHDLAFDELFRRHVRNVYRALDRPVPEELFVTNITTAPPAAGIEHPTGFIHPVIDGEATNYFEWVGAGCVDAAEVPGAMHQVDEQKAIVSVVEFGFDLEHLFIRVDGTVPMRRQLESGVEVRIKFLKPAGVEAVARIETSILAARLEKRLTAGPWKPRECVGLHVAAGEILEFQIPFQCLRAVAHTTVAFLVAVSRSGAELEQHPRHGPIEIEVPDREFPARNWTA
jgi:hypothetical protein